MKQITRTLSVALALLLPAAAALARPAPEKKAETTKTALEQVRSAIKEWKAEGRIDVSKADWKQHLPSFPKATFEDGLTYYWNLKTNLGEMKIRFMPTVAPNHVANFLYLTELGYFDGILFHRVITGFMAQAGDPTGTGGGGPGYSFCKETDPAVKHDSRGILSMAKRREPCTDGGQFFLTFVPTPWLDGKHTIFGRLVSGEATLDAIEARGSRNGKTTEEIKIKRAWITND